MKWLLREYNLADADQVLITGSSAGGVASFLWSNHIQGLVNNPHNVIVAADSNVFIRYNAYKSDIDVITQGFMNIFKLADIDEKTPLEECNKAFPG